MKALLSKTVLSAVVATLLALPVQADEGLPAAAAPQAAGWPMPNPSGAVGMWLPVPLPTRPGMPPALTWVPVVLVPLMVAPPLPQGAVVDYGPVSDMPAVVLPSPEEPQAPSAPAAEAVAPASLPTEVDYGPVAATPVVVLSSPEEPQIAPTPAAEAVAPAPSDAVAGSVPAWMPPDVDYGPVTATPVIDLQELEKQLSAPPPKPGKPSRPSSGASKPKAQATAKPAAPAKKRMCWENGIVAPCK
jgi:hypothetical protein